MDDNCNDGGTRYVDRDGRELTAHEYAALNNTTQQGGAEVNPAPTAAADEEEKVNDC